MSRRAVNPFYVLLTLVGVIFVITAFGYWVMAMRIQRFGPDAGLGPDAPRFMLWLARHGEIAMIVELAVLALATFAAILGDRYFYRPKRPH